MGTVRQIATGRRYVLPPRATVGRSHAADLQLTGSWISGEHAVIWWSGHQWRVRDLDSRNGTLLDGQHVSGNEGQPLQAGQTLAFGQLEEAWLVDDDAPPPALAVDRRTGTTAVAVDGVLSLPDEVEPDAVVYAEDDAWWIDRDGAREQTHDCDVVIVAGVVWTLRLPETARATDDAAHDPRPEELHLHLRIDRSRENIRVDLMHRGARIGLEPRAFHEVLLVLAEQRQEDTHLGSPERGWLDAQVLADMVGSTRATLNVHVQRLRRQFVDSGVVGPVIERRANHDLRLVELNVIRIEPQ